MTIGKKEIENAILNLKFDKDYYDAIDIDEMIWKYYGIKSYDEYVFATQESGDFAYLADTYEVIDEVLKRRGFTGNDDMTEYYRNGLDHKPEPDEGVQMKLIEEEE